MRMKTTPLSDTETAIGLEPSRDGAVTGSGGGEDLPDEALMTRNTGSRERASREDIAQLAYHLWEARGRPAGSDVEDWLSAERELAYHFD
jgi:hypothetical protein